MSSGHNKPDIPAGVLSFMTMDEAINLAKEEMNSERSDEQLGLYSNWAGINRGMGKYFRFNHITQIAGLSGHGKSYFINQLIDNFTDTKDFYDSNGTLIRKALNRNFKPRALFIHFGFEMDPSDEVLRMLTRRIAKSYHYILSSEWDSKTNDFNKITDEEYTSITKQFAYLDDRPVVFVHNAGNIAAMYRTVVYLRKKYAKLWGIPDHEVQLMIGIDHSFLVKKDPGMTDLLLTQAVAFLALKIRKDFKAMVFILGQCNNNLKSIERISERSLHYPLDSDVYMGAQINWVCDNIWIIYRPELVNITEYGTEKIPTEGLVVASCVKSRKGVIGDVFLRNSLHEGRYVDFTANLPEV
jgi:replicative DNA helicase